MAVAFGANPVQPLAGGHGLSGGRVVAEPAPVAIIMQLLVGNRTFDHEYEGFELSAVGFEEPFQEVVRAPVGSALKVDQWPVHRDLGQSR